MSGVAIAINMQCESNSNQWEGFVITGGSTKFGPLETLFIIILTISMSLPTSSKHHVFYTEVTLHINQLISFNFTRASNLQVPTSTNLCGTSELH
jgi:hypothetical protein